MPDEIQKLDLSDATEQLKAKIQSAFVDIIPDEQWTAMIEGELKKFTQDTSTENRYGTVTVTPSGFETLAQGILLDVAREKLKAKLEKPDFIPDGQTVQGIIVDWLEKNQDTLVSHFMKEVSANIFAALAANAASDVTSIISDAFNTGKGIRDPNNPGYDKAGNYIE